MITELGLTKGVIRSSSCTPLREKDWLRRKKELPNQTKEKTVVRKESILFTTPPSVSGRTVWMRCVGVMAGMLSNLSMQVAIWASTAVCHCLVVMWMCQVLPLL